VTPHTVCSGGEEDDDRKFVRKVRLSPQQYKCILTPHRQLKGMFQNALIMYTLVHAYFVEYGSDIPTGIELDDNMKPVGALILSLQAVCTSFLQFPYLLTFFLAG